ncbi:MAG: hypothetical protein M3N21_04520 [Actinomycetota bacterium]|nr:hypothetical protein [Actinomycetota bacterium]
MRRLLALTLSVAVLLGLSAVNAGAVSTQLSGPDVASYQHPNGASIDWAAVRNEGRSWAFVKATEGTTYTNPYFAGDWRGASAAGLYRGAYHYARPSGTANSAQDQAHFFASTIGSQSIPGTLPPIIDLEDSGGLSSAALVTWVTDFLTALQAATGRTPMLYTYPNFWHTQMADSTAFFTYPLWIANYGVSSPQSLGWPHWTFWQYTSTATVNGIPSPGATDVSYFNGTALDLAALALAGTWKPPSSSANDQTEVGSPPGRYVPVSPVRFVDTRSGQGAPSGPVNGAVTVTVPGSVPADAVGVVLDVSAVTPRGPGWLRVSAAGTPPQTTALNYPAQHGVTGLVTTSTDSQRQVTVTTYSSATDLVLDLVGYYTAGAGTGGFWSPLPPTRVVDTRFGLNAPSGPMTGDLTFTLPDSVPATAVGVVLDVTAVEAKGDGYLRLAATGTAATTTALNFEGGGSMTGLAMTRATGNQVTVSVAGAPTDLVVDLVGFYEGVATSGSGFVALPPMRFVDTRSGLGATGPGTGPLLVTVPAAVPRDATAVLLDLSAVLPDNKGYVRLAAPGTDAVTTAINVLPGRSRTGLVSTGVRDGQITLAVYGASTHLVIDLLGYQAAVPCAVPPTPSPSATPTATPTASGTASPSPTPSPSPSGCAASSPTPSPSAS